MSVCSIFYHKLPQVSSLECEEPVKSGDRIVVEIDQGLVLATVISNPSRPEYEETASTEPRPLFVRCADDFDLARGEENNQFATEVRAFWMQCVRRRHLDMKIVDVEVFLDRSKFVFYFTSPARIDFRDLVKDLVHEYRVRIELRQIGVRHEAQLIGALGNCGMVCCCRRYLHQFAPVTIRMAKEQNLFLNPTKVSGICGRLLCCLANEQHCYDSFHHECPKLGKRYQTTRGPLRIVRSNMFSNTVTCVSDSGEEVQVTLDEWKALEPRRPESSAQPSNKQVAPPAADEYMVVTATPDSIADSTFDEKFSDLLEDEGLVHSDPYGWGASLPDDPVMQPGAGEAHRKKRRRNKPSRQEPSSRSPQTGSSQPRKPEAAKEVEEAPAPEDTPAAPAQPSAVVPDGERLPVEETTPQAAADVPEWHGGGGEDIPVGRDLLKASFSVTLEDHDGESLEQRFGLAPGEGDDGSSSADTADAGRNRSDSRRSVRSSVLRKGFLPNGRSDHAAANERGGRRAENRQDARRGENGSARQDGPVSGDQRRSRRSGSAESARGEGQRPVRGERTERGPARDGQRAERTGGRPERDARRAPQSGRMAARPNRNARPEGRGVRQRPAMESSLGGADLDDWIGDSPSSVSPAADTARPVGDMQGKRSRNQARGHRHQGEGGRNVREGMAPSDDGSRLSSGDAPKTGE